MGHWMRQLLATLCVASSLALVALGGSNLTGWFHLRTLSFGRPHGNHGPVLDMVAISHDIEGASYEESDDTQAHFYLACRAHPLCLLGYCTMGL
jgi:hypothetical protein